jgi:hypothetical protein
VLRHTAGLLVCRYDVGVFTNCASSIDLHCAAAKSQLRANATVLKCLVQNFAALDDLCQTEMSRAVRYALWDYSDGQALTADCDDDVDTFCPKVSGSGTQLLLLLQLVAVVVVVVGSGCWRGAIVVILALAWGVWHNCQLPEVLGATPNSWWIQV